MKKKLQLLIIAVILPILTIPLASCATCTKEEQNALINEIRIPAFPAIENADGSPRAIFMPELNGILITPELWLELINYGLDVETAAAMLDAARK